MNNLLSQKREFILYCLIGGLGTAVTCASYALLVQFFQLHYQLANAIGYAAGTVVSFVLNARYNFRAQDRPLQRMLCFSLVALLGWAAAAGLLALLVGYFGLNALLAYLFVITAVLLLQYNLNRLVSFRKVR